MTHTQLKGFILAAEFAIIIAIFSQLIVPLGLVPLTGQTFAVGLCATVLKRKYSCWAITIYLLLGLIGLPVFAGMASGIGALFGPTGGFLFGFLLTGWITGSYLQHFGYHYFHAITANLLGAFATLIMGTIWLAFSGHLSATAAFNAGFMPFIVPAIIKAAAAGWLGALLYKRIRYFQISD
ncbi:biotin transporter BioY [Loigolactobacillus backii]|uniref:Biotin transporter n=1 Tax=Loigolactobacillus backii TaxID=375175 RepID=A0A192H1G4_9LACO|nr:biotin transporter BioY [Loigolactobacillus backii]ANK59236.1 BioY family transporter [Loigolactobacillus backii]ANK62649.1 BioY family transporter [Loigolactobacillus backii]ANK64227.1 BioY family transporter [Loigolactobacillus backii]ANK67378.1 BioY family transporter [Loigolactobacillus backii]ANK70343.1 BioY family transporter [Loigolactobacillus backii]